MTARRMPDTDHLAVDAVRHAFSAQGHAVSEVDITGEATGGATRSTYFVDVDHEAAVAQITPAGLATIPPPAEAELLSLLEEHGVPAPHVLASSETTLVTSFVEGMTIPRHILRSIGEDRVAAETLVADCGETLAKLHSIDVNRLDPRIERFDGPTPSATYLHSLNETLSMLDKPLPIVRFGLAWLARHKLEPIPSTSIVHGDFRLGNLVVQENRLAAVLDWELCHGGDPMEDVAYFCMRTWRFGNHDRIAGGIGSKHDLMSSYVTHGGTWRPRAFEWWMIAKTAWWTIGLAAQAERFSAGDSRSIVHAASGRKVAELEYDLLRLIDKDPHRPESG